METLIWLGLGAFLFSLILTPIIRDIFNLYGIVDRPDTLRKSHSHPIPRVGGTGIAISYALSLYLVSLRPHAFDHTQFSLVQALLPSAALVFVIGLIDDFSGLRPWQKLVGQVAAASMAYGAGVRIVALAGHPTSPWWSFIVTIVWLVACTNAFNLIDGLDGLAAGIGFFATLTIFIAALIMHNTALVSATLPMAGCLLGFLCYNFSPATVFLGDCGSLLIGFLLGCYGVIWTNKSFTLLGMTAPLIALSLPLLDVLLAVTRRLVRRQSVFAADRGHIHHRLIDRGLTPRRVVLIIYAICAAAAAFSLLQSFVRNTYIALLVVVVVAWAVWAGVRYLRYSELILAGSLFSAGQFRRTLDVKLALEGLAAALAAAGSLEARWDVIRKRYPELGFVAAHLRINGVSYRDWPEELSERECWIVKIPLSAVDFIELAHGFGSEQMPNIIAPMVDLLRYTLVEHVEEDPLRSSLRSAIVS
ncbi:MAG TPA: MraY family glycosyltransferase [Bryobacteraceae bacterium]|nr:MraY family glycosyltransferase [Bryobacteraceae bacterium]